MSATENRQEISKGIARFAAEMTYDKVPVDIRKQIKDLIMDTVGCTLAAQIEESSDILIDSFYDEIAADRGCSIFGYGFKSNNTAMAAMINATLGHTTELDDECLTGPLHAAVVVIPTALALGQKYNLPGRDIIAACLAGYEVSIHIGKAIHEGLYLAGWHPTGVLGVFASAATAGNLLKLNEEQMVHALGIAYSQAAGNREWKANGAWSKRLQAGYPNFHGITAAMLAKNGYTGASTFVEGTYGFLNDYSCQRKYPVKDELVLKGLGEEFDIRGNLIKPYASCRYPHAVIDSTMKLVTEYDLTPGDIKAIRIGVGENALISCATPLERKLKPQNRVDAQFNLPYASALVIHQRKAFLEEFGPKYFTNPEILKTVSKVTCYKDEECDALAKKGGTTGTGGAIVEIEANDGRVVRERTIYPKGDPENPFTPKELVEKYREMAKYGLSQDRINASIELFERFDTLENISELCELLEGEPKR